MYFLTKRDKEIMVNQLFICMLLHALDFNDVNHKNHEKN